MLTTILWIIGGLVFGFVARLCWDMYHKKNTREVNVPQYPFEPGEKNVYLTFRLRRPRKERTEKWQPKQMEKPVRQAQGNAQTQMRRPRN